MIFIRCTQRLLRSGRVAVDDDLEGQADSLSEWYANAVPLSFPGRWVVMYTSASTLLTVVTPGRSLRTTLPVFRRRLPALLERLEIRDSWINHWWEEIREARFGRTRDRRVLGSMNDFGRYIQYAADDVGRFEELSLNDIEWSLSGVPMKYIGYDSPVQRVTRLASGTPDDTGS